MNESRETGGERRDAPAVSRVEAMGTRLEMPEGVESVYGRFEGQILLGVPATLTFDRLGDGDPRALDILGCPLRRKAAAIHISGKDDFGGKAEPGWVREIAWQTTELPPGRTMGGTDPHAVCIVSNIYDQKAKWGSDKYHIAQWSSCDGYVTIDGIAAAFPMNDAMKPYFTAQDVLDRINEVGKDKRSWKIEGRQHTAAIHRLLEAMVGAQNVAAAPGKELIRFSRWK